MKEPFAQGIAVYGVRVKEALINETLGSIVGKGLGKTALVED